MSFVSHLCDYERFHIVIYTCFLYYSSVPWDYRTSAYSPQCSACSASWYTTVVVFVKVTFVKHVMYTWKYGLRKRWDTFIDVHICTCVLGAQGICVHVVIVSTFSRCERLMANENKRDDEQLCDMLLSMKNYRL